MNCPPPHRIHSSIMKRAIVSTSILLLLSGVYVSGKSQAPSPQGDQLQPILGTPAPFGFFGFPGTIQPQTFVNVPPIAPNPFFTAFGSPGGIQVAGQPFLPVFNNPSQQFTLPNSFPTTSLAGSPVDDIASSAFSDTEFPAETVTFVETHVNIDAEAPTEIETTDHDTEPQEELLNISSYNGSSFPSLSSADFPDETVAVDNTQINRNDEVSEGTSTADQNTVPHKALSPEISQGETSSFSSFSSTEFPSETAPLETAQINHEAGVTERIKTTDHNTNFQEVFSPEISHNERATSLNLSSIEFPIENLTPDVVQTHRTSGTLDEIVSEDENADVQANLSAIFSSTSFRGSENLNHSEISFTAPGNPVAEGNTGEESLLSSQKSQSSETLTENSTFSSADQPVFSERFPSTVAPLSSPLTEVTTTTHKTSSSLSADERQPVTSNSRAKLSTLLSENAETAGFTTVTPPVITTIPTTSVPLQTPLDNEGVNAERRIETSVREVDVANFPDTELDAPVTKQEDDPTPTAENARETLASKIKELKLKLSQSKNTEDQQIQAESNQPRNDSAKENSFQVTDFNQNVSNSLIDQVDIAPGSHSTVEPQIPENHSSFRNPDTEEKIESRVINDEKQSLFPVLDSKGTSDTTTESGDESHFSEVQNLENRKETSVPGPSSHPGDTITDPNQDYFYDYDQPETQDNDKTNIDITTTSTANTPAPRTTSLADALSRMTTTLRPTTSEASNQRGRSRPSSREQLLQRLKRLRERRLSTTVGPRHQATQNIEKPKSNNTDDSDNVLRNRRLNNRRRPSERRTENDFYHRLRNRIFTTRTPQQVPQTLAVEKEPVVIIHKPTTKKPLSFRERLNLYRQNNRFIPKDRRRTTVQTTTPAPTTTKAAVTVNEVTIDFDNEFTTAETFVTPTFTTEATPSSRMQEIKEKISAMLSSSGLSRSPTTEELHSVLEDITTESQNTEASFNSATQSTVLTLLNTAIDSSQATTQTTLEEDGEPTEVPFEDILTKIFETFKSSAAPPLTSAFTLPLITDPTTITPSEAFFQTFSSTNFTTDSDAIPVTRPLIDESDFSTISILPKSNTIRSDISNESAQSSTQIPMTTVFTEDETPGETTESDSKKSETRFTQSTDDDIARRTESNTQKSIPGRDSSVQDLIARLIAQGIITEAKPEESLTPPPSAKTKVSENDVLNIKDFTTHVAITERIEDEVTTRLPKDQDMDVITEFADITSMFERGDENDQQTTFLPDFTVLSSIPTLSDSLATPTQTTPTSTRFTAFTPSDPLISKVKMMDTTEKFGKDTTELPTQDPNTEVPVPHNQDFAVHVNKDLFDLPTTNFTQETSESSTLNISEINEVDNSASMDHLNLLLHSFGSSSIRPELSAVNRVLGLKLFTPSSGDEEHVDVNLEQPELLEDYYQYDDVMEPSATEHFIFTSPVETQTLDYQELTNAENTTLIQDVTVSEDLTPTVLNMEVTSLTVSEPSVVVKSLSEEQTVTNQTNGEAEDNTNDGKSEVKNEQTVSSITVEPLVVSASDVNHEEIFPSNMKLEAESTLETLPTEKAESETHPTVTEKASDLDAVPETQLRTGSEHSISDPTQHTFSNSNSDNTQDHSTSSSTSGSKAIVRERPDLLSLLKDRERNGRKNNSSRLLPPQRGNIMHVERERDTSVNDSSQNSRNRVSLSQLLSQRALPGGSALSSDHVPHNGNNMGSKGSSESGLKGENVATKPSVIKAPVTDQNTESESTTETDRHRELALMKFLALNSKMLQNLRTSNPKQSPDTPESTHSEDTDVRSVTDSSSTSFTTITPGIGKTIDNLQSAVRGQTVAPVQEKVNTQPTTFLRRVPQPRFINVSLSDHLTQSARPAFTGNLPSTNSRKDPPQFLIPSRKSSDNGTTRSVVPLTPRTHPLSSPTRFLNSKESEDDPQPSLHHRLPLVPRPTIESVTNKAEIQESSTKTPTSFLMPLPPNGFDSDTPTTLKPLSKINHIMEHSHATERHRFTTAVPTTTRNSVGRFTTLASLLSSRTDGTSRHGITSSRPRITNPEFDDFTTQLGITEIETVTPETAQDDFQEFTTQLGPIDIEPVTFPAVEDESTMSPISADESDKENPSVIEGKTLTEVPPGVRFKPSRFLSKNTSTAPRNRVNPNQSFSRNENFDSVPNTQTLTLPNSFRRQTPKPNELSGRIKNKSNTPLSTSVHKIGGDEASVTTVSPSTFFESSTTDFGINIATTLSSLFGIDFGSTTPTPFITTIPNNPTDSASAKPQPTSPAAFINQEDVFFSEDEGLPTTAANLDFEFPTETESTPTSTLPTVPVTPKIILVAFPVANATTTAKSQVPSIWSSNTEKQNNHMNKLPPSQLLRNKNRVQESHLSNTVQEQDSHLRNVFLASLPAGIRTQQQTTPRNTFLPRSQEDFPLQQHSITQGVNLKAEEGFISRRPGPTEASVNQQEVVQKGSVRTTPPSITFTDDPITHQEFAQEGSGLNSASVDNDPDNDQIPGEGGIDYPILDFIPATSFKCTKRMSKGGMMFADPETACQVYHVCNAHQKFSFLCPRGTIFNQDTVVCQWWYTVDCFAQARKLAEVQALGDS